jgi:hypothetical protein
MIASGADEGLSVNGFLSRCFEFFARFAINPFAGTFPSLTV